MCVVCVCVYHCAQLSYATQHRAVLIIFPLILQTSNGAQMLFIGGERELNENAPASNYKSG